MCNEIRSNSQRENGWNPTKPDTYDCTSNAIKNKSSCEFDEFGEHSIEAARYLILQIHEKKKNCYGYESDY